MSVDFVKECVNAGKLLDTDPYIVYGKTKAEELSVGKIVG